MMNSTQCSTQSICFGNRANVLVICAAWFVPFVYFRLWLWSPLDNCSSSLFNQNWVSTDSSNWWVSRNWLTELPASSWLSALRQNY
jgi:hypothetical protein